MNTLKLITLAIILLFLNKKLSAQISIDGTISDSDLNPITNALVEIIDEKDTSNFYAATTNELGYFSISGITDVESSGLNIPKKIIFLRNYPNPFNPSTLIYYELPRSENIEIIIYDILGRKVRTLFNNFHNAGTYTLEWNGRNDRNTSVAAGIYFCSLKTKDQYKVHKMVLLDGGSTHTSISSVTLNKSSQHTFSSLRSIFNFTIKVSGSNILDSDFKYMSCTDDTTLNLLVPKVLQKTTIGPEGGTLGIENFSLIVPHGAFQSEENLSLYESMLQPLEENSNSDVFHLAGFPDHYSLPIKIKIKHSGPLSEENYIIYGQEGMEAENGEPVIVYDHIFSNDSAGYLVGEIPIPEENTSSIVNKRNAKNKYILFRAISKYLTFIEGSETHYKIFLPENNVSFKPEIVSYFDLAYTVFIELGFEPLDIFSIFITNLGDKFCKFHWRNALGGKKAKGIFVVNHNKLDDLATMKIMIGKEVLRSILFYLDPIFPIMTGPKFQAHHWLNQAVITWSEQFFIPESEIDGYVPSDFSSNEMAPFKGLSSRIYSDPDVLLTDMTNFGNGMSAFIYHLFEKYGKDVLLNIYDEIKRKSNPISAIKYALPHTVKLEDEWKEFIEVYLTGGIYEVPSHIIKNTIKDPGNKFIIDKETEIEHTFHKSYDEYSVQLFEIDRLNPQTDDILEFTFNLKPPLIPETRGITFLGLKDNIFNNLEYQFGWTQRIKQKYESFVIAIINDENKQNIDLDVKIKVVENIKEVKFSKATLSFKIDYNQLTKYKDDTPDAEGWVTYNSDWFNQYSSNLPGSMTSDSTFTAYEWISETANNNSGNMWATVNGQTASLHYKDTQKGTDFSVVIEIDAHDLELTWESEYGRMYKVIGPGTKNHISKFSYKYNTSNPSWTGIVSQVSTDYKSSEYSMVSLMLLYEE